MRVRVGALVLFCLLLSPAASAAEGQGSFVVQGGVHVSSNTAIEGSVLAFLVEDATGPKRLDMALPQARVTVYEQRYQTVAGVNLASGFAAPSWTVQAATVRLVVGGDNAGFVGLYPSAGGSVEATTTSPAASEARTSSAFGTVEVATTDKPSVPHYYQEISDPHILTTATGGLTYVGRGAVKVNGPDIEISQAAGNTTRHETGIRQTTATELVIRWVFIELDAQAVVTMEGADGFTMATARAAFTARGTLTFTPATGELRTKDGVYEANNTTASVSGQFNAVLSPLATTGTARLELSGNMWPSVSLVQQPAPAAFGSKSGSWWVGLLLGTVVAGGTMFGIHKRRRHARTGPASRAKPPSAPFPTGVGKDTIGKQRVKDISEARSPILDVSTGATLCYLEGLAIADTLRDWSACVEIVRATKRTLPPEGAEQIHADRTLKEAEYILFTGDHARAYAAFEEAAHLLDMESQKAAEAHYWAAVCLLRDGAADESALRHVEEALDLAPDLAADMGAEEAFDSLREMPRFCNAMLSAYERSRRVGNGGAQS